VPLQLAKSWQDNPFGNGRKFRYASKNVRCYIFQCRGLSPADENGVSDPFVKILSHYSEDSTTPVIEDNLNPIFLCARTVSMEFRDKSDIQNTPVLLSVFDSDDGILLKSEDFLGRSFIYLREASFNTNPLEIPTPEWHPIKYSVHKNSP
jgi:Ca2+-dependent lipid-binding protein